MANVLMKMASEPEFVKKAMTASTKKAITISKVLLEEGCDGILLESDYCSNQGSMMSPKHFEEYIHPSLKEHCHVIHKLGGYCIKHTDGNIWSIMDIMIEAGIEAWQGIQPSIGMDMRLLKERYGDKICPVEGVDCDTLINGSPEDVQKETEYAIRYAAPGGGLVLCSANTLMVGVKYDNKAIHLTAPKKT